MRPANALAAALLALATGPAWSQDNAMSFFVTSTNPGDGGNFGGLEGADAHCTALAEAAGVTGRTWAAYLSTSEVDARDRIGTGPWANAEGVLIAESVEALHGDGNNISQETAIDENGNQIELHDILTGSMPDGTADEQTCGDWTDGGTEAAGMVGHHNRTGLDESEASRSWNSSHPSRGGCGLEALRGTRGDGLVYCFAVE